MTGGESEKQRSRVEERDALLLEKFEVHRDFTRVFLDAFVLLNEQRRVLKFNQMFCTLLGMRAIDVRRAERFDELLKTDLVGSPQSALDLICSATGPVRVDEVQGLRPNSDEPVQLIMSSYPYFDDAGTFLGTCVVIRDVTAESNLQGKYKEKAIQSVTDPLTGLFTRRYFEDWIEKEIERCRAQGIKPSVGILMFDLDKFKTVNDTYGHQAGDFVLSETAKVLRLNSRKSDVLGRYGGEEMLALLLGSTARGCCIAAEKFRQAIQNHEFVFEGRRIPVTTSVGLSVFLSNVETREAVVARADRCLYAAKHGGRNTVFADFGEGEFRVSDNLSLIEDV